LESLDNLFDFYKACNKPEKAKEWRAKLPPKVTSLHKYSAALTFYQMACLGGQKIAAISMRF
jgi:hypothetical protein